MVKLLNSFEKTSKKFQKNLGPITILAKRVASMQSDLPLFDKSLTITNISKPLNLKEIRDVRKRTRQKKELVC